MECDICGFADGMVLPLGIASTVCHLPGRGVTA
jgi:hypothetical protein